MEEPEITIEKVHYLIYVAAYTVIQMHGQTIIERERENQRKKSTLLAWERRLKNKIAELRKKIGQLTQAMRPNPSSKIRRATDTILAQHRTDSLKETPEILEYLKQKLGAIANRPRRYQKAKIKKEQNLMFHQNQCLFYKKLDSNANNERAGTYPTADIIKEFWNGIWGKDVNHTEGQWKRHEDQSVSAIRTMEYVNITAGDVKEALKRTQNWKAPGADHIHNYWYKKFQTSH